MSSIIPSGLSNESAGGSRKSGDNARQSRTGETKTQDEACLTFPGDGIRPHGWENGRYPTLRHVLTLAVLQSCCGDE